MIALRGRDVAAILLCRALLILGLAAVGCTPAIIGISFAAGGATVGVTYEILGKDEPRDAGADAEGEQR